MKTILRLLLGLLLVAALMPVGTVKAQAPAVTCETFALDIPGNPLYIPGVTAIPAVGPSGSEICMILPSAQTWNGGLVVFAHGYVFAYPPDKPVTIPWDQVIMRDGATILGSIAQLVVSQGFAFATTSYSKNGLAVVEGVQDVLELVTVFKATVAPMLPPGVEVPVFLIGASEGGLVTTLALEGYPQVFKGGVAACGPIGDFRKQIDYWGNFRVVYDYYFPDNLLGESAMSISAETMAGWGNLYDPTQAEWGPVLWQNFGLISADLSNPEKPGLSTHRLLAATGAPVNPVDPNSIFLTTLGILEYNVMATNEAIQELGGIPYSNRGVYFFTFPPDPNLNKSVERISADKAALTAIKAGYQTKGLLQRPLVVMHTTGDPIVPFWHAALYTGKTYMTKTNQYLKVIPVKRYGHCAFTPEEELAAFGTMIQMALQQAPMEVPPEAQSR